MEHNWADLGKNWGWSKAALSKDGSAATGMGATPSDQRPLAGTGALPSPTAVCPAHLPVKTGPPAHASPWVPSSAPIAG